jgi:ribosomal protein L7/L12
MVKNHEYEITIRAEVELELPIEAENFHEAVEKALEIAECPWALDDYDTNYVTMHAAEVAGVTKAEEVGAFSSLFERDVHRTARQFEELIKDDYEVVMGSYGTQKIKVIKAVRAFTGLGLKEAKSMVESAPTAIAAVSSLTEASTIKTALESAGASVFINSPHQDNVVDFRPSPQSHSNKDEG